MLVTESKLRQIVKEEYRKLVNEAGLDPLRYHNQNLRANRKLYSQTGGGASELDAAAQTLFSVRESPEHVKKVYDSLKTRFGEEIVNNFIKSNKNYTEIARILGI